MLRRDDANISASNTQTVPQARETTVQIAQKSVLLVWKQKKEQGMMSPDE